MTYKRKYPPSEQGQDHEFLEVSNMKKKSITRSLYDSLDPLYQAIIDVKMMTSNDVCIVEENQNREGSASL